MKVALVYDRVNKWGGAERVLLALHKLFKEAPLYTSVYNSATASWASDFKIHTSFLQSFPFAKSSHEYLAPLMPLAFESFSFSRYDLVISVSSEAAKGILTKPKTKHLCYCLTPTRYLWSGYNDYFVNPLSRTLSKPAVSYLRTWDTIAAQRPDGYIAISHEVQSRIKTYYGRDSDVVYPPVTLTDDRRSINFPQSIFKNLSSTVYHPSSKNNYFLIVSRLVPYKRIDIAIQAANRLKLPLKIVGTGSAEAFLKSIAGPTIEFVGNLTDVELVEYYKGCQGLIFPGKEDFGLTIVEAQRFGKPVLALKDGGALETIDEGKTGSFFYPQTVEALEKAIESFVKKTFGSEFCKKQAEKFSEEQFKQQFLAVVEKYL